MNPEIFQVDAFTDELFKGNPAAVVPLTDAWLPDELLQKIAAENNLSETAFFLQKKDVFPIRWFTPVAEVDLCGHATLATAHVLWKELEFDGPVISFSSRSGMLHVVREHGAYTLDFPTDQLTEVTPPDELMEALGIVPLEIYRGREDYLVVYETLKDVSSLRPDFKMMARISSRGVIATAPGDETDFVSRCFFPAYGIDEDPVTGSAHTTLTPYWHNRLQKTNMTARQLSGRGGDLRLRYQQDRTAISGNAVTYLKGKVFLENRKAGRRE